LELPETIETQTGAEPTGSVIWLHGLGADGHDFEPIVPELAIPDSLVLRFVFPHAPVRPVTINGGVAMRAWYDILGFDPSAPQDEAGIRDSADMLGRLVARESSRGIAAENIVVAGFSQGGSVAMHMAIRRPERLAGLMALSTWLPLHTSLDREVAANERSQPRDLPVFLAHGSADPMLPIAMGRFSRERLEALGAEEIADIRAWLLRLYGVG